MSSPSATSCARRRGITLLEMLLALAIMATLVAALGTMASAVYDSTQYADGYGGVAQHARVIGDRIGRTIGDATAGASFPGVLVLTEQIAGWSFPDTLVVWHPQSAVADPDAKPRLNELVVYCPDPDGNSELLEITTPNTDVAPDVDDLAGWTSAIDAIKADTTSRRVVLTNLLRVATLPEAISLGTGWQRGCVRFVSRLRPSEAEWNEYQSGSRAWSDLSWAQSLGGSQTGMRQTWVRFELQLDPSLEEGVEADKTQPVAFFGSGAVYYPLKRSP